jgi:type IV pilus assembly protein PilB
MRKILNKHLGEVLLEKGVINRSQLDKAIEFQKGRGGLIGEILLEMDYVKEEDIAQALTAQYGFPFLPLNNYEISPDIAEIIPERVARQYLLVPIDRIGKNLTIAMSNPLNVQAVEDVELISGCSVQVFVSTTSDTKRAIDKCYKKKA